MVSFFFRMVKYKWIMTFSKWLPHVDNDLIEGFADDDTNASASTSGTNTSASTSGTHVIYNGEEVPATSSTSCLLYTSPSPRDLSTSRMPSSA